MCTVHVWHAGIYVPYAYMVYDYNYVTVSAKTSLVHTKN